MSGKYWGLAGLVLLYYAALRPRMLAWGLSAKQAQQSYPGDEIILHPLFTMTHVIEMNATPEVLWRWLAQMGRDDVGFYAFDASLNRGIRSATHLRPHLPPLATGMQLDNGYQVLRFQPADYLVIGAFQQTLGGLYDVTQSYQLKAISAQRTRLFWRVRLYAYGLIGLGMSQVLEPWYFAFGQLHLQHLATLSTQAFPKPEASKGHYPQKIVSFT